MPKQEFQATHSFFWQESVRVRWKHSVFLVRAGRLRVIGLPYIRKELCRDFKSCGLVVLFVWASWFASERM
jgi:hypothetical protein